MHIKDWIRYHTEFWNDDHEKLALDIAKKLVWYRPNIRKRILELVEERLSHVKEKQDE